MNLTFRPSSPEYRDLITSALTDNAKDFKPALTEEWIQKHVEFAIDSRYSFMAFRGSSFVGFICFKPYEPGDLLKNIYRDVERFEGYAYPKNIFILPEHRRKGYAKKLRIYGVERMRELGFKGVVTTCWAKNTPMIALNKSMGFTFVDRVPAPWRGPGEETLIYEKRFSERRSKDS